MAHQAHVSTLGQLLRQAGDVQSLSIQQIPTRLHHPDGRFITPTSLPVLAYDRRRPLLALAHECATVFALGLVFTWAPPAARRLRQYLQRCANTETACIEMHFQAEPYGWTPCERVTRQIVAPEAPPAHQNRMRACRTRLRRLHHADRSGRRQPTVRCGPRHAKPWCLTRVEPLWRTPNMGLICDTRPRE